LLRPPHPPSRLPSSVSSPYTVDMLSTRPLHFHLLHKNYKIIPFSFALLHPFPIYLYTHFIALEHRCRCLAPANAVRARSPRAGVRSASKVNYYDTM
jgi:hypothetical protein